jgi:hypothetical protein
MACHPKLTVARVKAHRRSLCELWWASFACIRERRMERETGIEPATNSLEGCDSTTELLPPTRLGRFASLTATAGTPAASLQPTRYFRNLLTGALNLHARKEGWWGGEGSNLRSPKAAGLQPAAIDRSATSPIRGPSSQASGLSA